MQTKFNECNIEKIERNFKFKYKSSNELSNPLMVWKFFDSIKKEDINKNIEKDKNNLNKIKESINSFESELKKKLWKYGIWMLHWFKKLPWNIYLDS